MDLENSEVEKTEVAPETIEASIEETQETPEISEENTEVEEAPSYTPTFKYKVRDEEREMDEWIRPYVKDEDTEKRFVDLLTARDGIDLAKKEREEFKSKYSDLESAVLHVSKLANEGKIGKFIEELGLPKKAFIDYAIREQQYQNLPPEQKMEIDAQRQRESQIEQDQLRMQTLEQEYQAQQVQMRRMELDNTLMRPDFAEAQRIYDESVGTPGSFRQLVARVGNHHWTNNGVDIPVEQAISEAIQLGRVNVGTQQPNQTTGNVGTQTTVQNQPTEKKVIPNFRGGGSPAKKQFKSLDELREYSAKRR